MKYRFFFTLLLLGICFTGTLTIRSQEPKLVALREQFARRYMQPDAHFALAKYYLDREDYVQAFFIIEYARRYRFDEKTFDPAYFAYFGDPMPEPPDDAKAAFESASKLVTEQKYDEAEAQFLRSYKLYGRSFFINGWIGRFYYKVKTDNARALPFYFKSYFLYPHAYETEFVESRIRRITVDDAESSFKASLSMGKTLSDLARDKNPLIVGGAIGSMAADWRPEYERVVLEAIDNDDSIVRWSAFATLQKYNGPALDRLVNTWLTGSDLRKRGLAAYAIVERPGQEKYETLTKMLADPSELVRFDALSALALKGGPKGMQILKKHRLTEAQPRLSALIDMSLKQEPK